MKIYKKVSAGHGTGLNAFCSTARPAVTELFFRILRTVSSVEYTLSGPNILVFVKSHPIYYRQKFHALSIRQSHIGAQNTARYGI